MLRQETVQLHLDQSLAIVDQIQDLLLDYPVIEGAIALRILLRIQQKTGLEILNESQMFEQVDPLIDDFLNEMRDHISESLKSNACNASLKGI